MSRDVDEARSGRGRVREHEFVAKTEANSHEVEAEAKIIALFFSAKFYISTPFSPKKRNVRSIFDETSKISAQTGFDMGTLLVNTRKMTSNAFWRRLLLLCLHTE